ncbi:hypothetical protein HMPREF0972_01514 [Actinomyces sp. oral taxon 848 str. F0332]|nr:hypothetical protein HMPREF0972_01514 [Actinomyces sp. oral taxon 848 str. F0332]
MDRRGLVWLTWRKPIRGSTTSRQSRFDGFQTTRIPRRRRTRTARKPQVTCCF